MSRCFLLLDGTHIRSGKDDILAWQKEKNNLIKKEIRKMERQKKRKKNIKFIKISAWMPSNACLWRKPTRQSLGCQHSY